MEGNPLFPVFLKIDQLSVLVVGGGEIALEKLEALIKNDPKANVTLISPVIDSEVKEFTASYSSVKILEKEFDQIDYSLFNIMIGATGDRNINIQLRDKAKQYNLLVNIADMPDLCDFYLGSTVKKGDLKIGISTNGKSPILARRMREVLEDILPDNTQSIIDNLKSIRDSLTGSFKEKLKTLDKITENLIK
ncbi:precorrin-2 dehydrogenase/sirohydrochlorin ferrochelatase family protein [Aureibacter tunicatorum]|uniref:precorrin-2 dehydrogenase n=1 Tax=Aureibacter tunicatorum TaxID=866807 RepID=A0AAE4BV18_9BACT|nr:bifunctional precorrin-2 dehydrogenase/sirohydrochlorin ferrochelatase [Aureibacter tunicatorum]MDR6241630.1 siroheme synthase-like protein [Aureibacter tunicatorum]BDD07254.1 siroheme synthase [Aureibacter tunicatorum]